jgi:Putative beta barrel porin-7 (BBP7)
MRTSIRTWLASVGVLAGAGGACLSAQGLPAIPIPDPMPLNQVKQTPKTESGKPVPVPMPMPMPMPPAAPLLPPVPPLEAPSGFVPGCSTCGDVNPNCADPGCAGDLIPGPKDPVWMSYSQLLLWFQPARATFPLAFDPTRNRVLINGEAEMGMYYGYKVDGGMWTNHEHTRGFGADGFITEHRSKFTRVAGGSITRPFFDAASGLQTSLLVSNDPAFTGELATTNTARLASAGVNIRRNVAFNESWQIDLSYGFRYYDLDESLVVFQRTVLPVSVTLGGTTINPGGVILLRDRSYTRNQFWGGDVGGHVEWKHGMTFLALSTKLAFGSTHQITQINGETRGVTPSTPPVDGGLLAVGRVSNGILDGNTGRFITNRFGIATDIGLKAGVSITPNARVSLGYQFYYLNNVARPGAQFDQTINQRNVPVSPSFNALTGVRAPNVTFDREGFFAHGVALTMEARY